MGNHPCLHRGRHRGSTLTVFAQEMSTAYVNLDPNDAFVADLAQIVRPVYDGLVAFRPLSGSAGNILVPDLATRIPVPTDSGRTYTFTLHKGIRYSNGSYVKASDFERSMERALVLPNSNPSLFESVMGAEDCIQRPGKPWTSRAASMPTIRPERCRSTCVRPTPTSSTT